MGGKENLIVGLFLLMAITLLMTLLVIKLRAYFRKRRYLIKKNPTNILRNIHSKLTRFRYLDKLLVFLALRISVLNDSSYEKNQEKSVVVFILILLVILLNFTIILPNVEIVWYLFLFYGLLGELLEEKVLLIDSNQYCCGVVDYLSNSSWTRGLDEFKINVDGGFNLSEADHHKWSKTITTRLDIMASNRYLQFSKDDIEKLQQYIEKIYSVTLVDTIAGENTLTDIFLQQSKVVLVILTQDQNQMRLIRDKGLYINEKDKVIFVINQYRENLEGTKIKYGFKEIKEGLKELGFIKNPVYSIPYDVALLNECNDSTLLNFCLAKENQTTQYHLQLKGLVGRILKDYGDFVLAKEIEAVGLKKSFFNFFNL